MDFTTRANKQRIDPSVMLDIVRSSPTLATAGEQSDSNMAAIVKALSTRTDLSDDERSAVAVSISFRLEALVRLIDEGTHPGSVRPANTEGAVVRENVIHLAATEPLINKGGRAAFDTERFLDALAHTDPAGAQSGSYSPYRGLDVF